MQSATTRGRTDTTEPVEARRAVDAAVAELAEERDLDHRELADALLEARDTLLVSGRVPDWFGEAAPERYAEMARE